MAFETRTVHELFVKNNLKQRFRMMRDFMIMPFRLENVEQAYQSA